MQERPARVLLGRIVAAHGIRGDVLVRSYTGEPAAIASYGPLSDESGARTFEARVVRVADKGVVARIAGVSDRNAAEALAGTDLYVARDRLPEPEPGAYYHADLIGLAALDPAGAPIGTVISVQNYGAGDLLEIRISGSRRTELVAFTDAFVPAVDLGARTVTVVMATDSEDHETP
jgi:16S rRNA processing protein RimM